MNGAATTTLAPKTSGKGTEATAETTEADCNPETKYPIEPPQRPTVNPAPVILWAMDIMDVSWGS